VIFNRKLNIAPDDLVITSVLAVVGRIAWIPMLLITCISILGTECYLSNPVYFYSISVLGLNILMLIGEVCGALVAYSGTVKNSAPRRHMGLLCHIEILLLFVDFCFQIHGIVVGFNFYYVDQTIQCLKEYSYGILTLIRIVVVWALVVDSIFFICLVLLLYNGSSSKKLISSDWNAYLKLWKRRIEWLITSPTAKTGEGQQVMSQVSTILANYFKEVDLAPSDMAVGLILLKREQKLLKRLTQLRNSNPHSEYWGTLEHAVIVEREDTEYEMQLLTKEAIDRISMVKQTSQSDSSSNLDYELKQDVENTQTLSSSTLIHHQSTGNLKSLDQFQYHFSNFSESVLDPKNLCRIQGKANDRRVDGRNFPLGIRAAKSQYAISISSNFEEFKDHAVRSARSMSFDKSSGENESIMKDLYARRQSMDWRFSSYAFRLSPTVDVMTNADILDVIHFTHYANMAYVELDSEIQKKFDFLVHFSPLNDIYRAPYLVSIDHDWNCIVIAIRGSVSTADLLVDLQLEMDILDQTLENAALYKVHSGMMRTAMNIVNDMVDHKVLEQIRYGPGSRVADYEIVVCGHSLGGVRLV
jgi:hypothetical protein